MKDPATLLQKLYELKQNDIDPRSGRLFTYIYETGINELRELALEAYRLFANTNALDPTVFRSAFFFERELVKNAMRLTNAPSDAVGTVTYGGTESIMLAVKAARYKFRKKYGFDKVPRVLVPVTGHPSIRKAAHYLGLKLEYLKVEREDKKLDVDDLSEKLDKDVALVVVSAPNFPYGTIDPVKKAAEIARERGVPVHVDACVGGYILPYMERLGYNPPLFDFRVDGVESISMDLHKYGYSPKGASIILFRAPEYKEGTIFVDLRWPGYPLINNTVLSSRSIAPLAAAWSTQAYLGEEGYLKLARDLLEARDDIYRGLSRLGFSSLAPIESPLLSLSLDLENDVFKYYSWMSLKGWVVGLQPKVEDLAPYNIHLTIMPIHRKVYKEFLKDSEEAINMPPPRELIDLLDLVQKDPMSAAQRIGETVLDGILIAKVLESIPKDYAEDLARMLAVEVYRR